jgi:predicted DNA-binding transcriptional regulator AlpA
MASDTLRVPEVAERLGLDYVEVYHLLSSGVLLGRPDRSGDMRVTVSSVEQYEASAASSA